VLGGVFISYRREDSAGFAGRIYDRLTRRLDPESVFLDVDNIQPGLDFFDVLSEKLGVCDVLIAVIGKNWNSSADKHNRRRLDDLDDFVRIEIEAALQRGIRVIPVLVDGATMPSREDLPDSLQRLRRRQAVEISHNRFDSDVERLIRALSLIEEETRQSEVAEAERDAHEKRERQEAAQATAAKEARRVAEAEVARRSEEERQAREVAEAESKEQQRREAANVNPKGGSAFAKDNVAIGMVLEPPGLDPTSAPAEAIGEVTHYNIFEGLTKINENFSVTPLLAEKWDLLPDLRTLTFTLKPNVKFQDGEPFSSKDVKYSFERFAAKESTNKDKSFFASIESIDTPDPTTVVLKFKHHPSSMRCFI
jgi:Bacterial extracellular solute-binding proteins, family 5 Middle/TIR domain